MVMDLFTFSFSWAYLILLVGSLVFSVMVYMNYKGASYARVFIWLVIAIGTLVASTLLNILDVSVSGVSLGDIIEQVGVMFVIAFSLLTLNKFTLGGK